MFTHVPLSPLVSSCVQEVEKCDLPTLFVAKNTGCLSVCTYNFWKPKCCRGFYGRDCLGERTVAASR